MMRLIDADTLMKECAECQKTDPHFEERGWANHFINAAGEPSTEWYCVEDMIENAPTIDAIPVGWLEAQISPYRDNLMDNGKGVFNATVKAIIYRWQKEQEAK